MNRVSRLHIFDYFIFTRGFTIRVFEDNPQTFLASMHGPLPSNNLNSLIGMISEMNREINTEYPLLSLSSSSYVSVVDATLSDAIIDIFRIGHFSLALPQNQKLLSESSVPRTNQTQYDVVR